MFSKFNQITRNATIIVSVDPLCTDDDMLKYIVQSVGIQCDQAVAHTRLVDLH